MQKKKKIHILLNDYTKPGPALKYGAHLAKQLHTPAILTAIEDPELIVSPFAVVGGGLPYVKYREQKNEKSDIRMHLRKLCIDMRPVWRELYFDTSPESSLRGLIRKTAEKNPSLLVVEGQNDLTTLNEWFGTFETKIAEDIDCPVLIVQSDTQWKTPEKILYVMDMDDSKVSNLRVLTDLTSKLDAHLQIILISEKEINEADGSYQKMVYTFKDLLGYKEPSFHRIFGEKKAKEIAGLVDTLAPDWFAFEQKNKNFIERSFDDYNTKRLILQSEIPVLVF